MSQILDLLFKALAKMPGTIAPVVNIDILLTLLFWKLLSDWSCGKGSRWQSHYHQPDAHIQHLWQQNQTIFNPQCLYGACEWAKPQDACLALRDALYRWHRLQNHSMLYAVLRPERFGHLSPYFSSFCHSPVLAEVIELIGSIDTAAANISIGQIFTQAMQTLEADGDVLPVSIAQLVASLLHPLPIDTVYDPLCASAQLLLACADDVASRVPRHQLQLYGQEPRANRWALAKMQLLAHGLTLHQLEPRDALSAPMQDKTRSHCLAADVVLLRIPPQLQEWDDAMADSENSPPFPLAPALAPAQERCLGLIRHAMAQLKGDTSRMAVILPLALLASAEGLALRRQMIEQKHLAAVIELPFATQPQQSLLLLRQHHPSNLVAFIASTAPEPGEPTPSGQYDPEAVLQAWRAAQQTLPAPYLRLIDDDTITQHHYQFKLPAYAAWLSFRHQPRQSNPIARKQALAKKRLKEKIMKADIDLHYRRIAPGGTLPTSNASSARRVGLVVVFTGNGKGKSSAAFGMAARALVHQMKVGVVQFCGGSPNSAEYQSMGQNPLCDFQICCADCSWQSKARSLDLANVQHAWAEAKRMIDDDRYDMVILDDINLLLKHQYVNLDEVLQTLRLRRPCVHVVLTGRYAPFELIDSADMVTEMRALKHPFPGQNIAPQAGVEF